MLPGALTGLLAFVLAGFGTGLERKSRNAPSSKSRAAVATMT
jgi:hypothetical protein